MGFTGYLILALVLFLVLAVLIAVRSSKKVRKLENENMELEAEIDKLEDEAKRHLEYMASIEKFKAKHKGNRQLIEEAEDEDGVKGSFDIAVAHLEQLRQLRKERREAKK